jgi:hypothetical protein
MHKLSFRTAIAVVSFASVASAQLRVVSFNTSNSASATAGPRAGMSTILSAIGSSISDDPTMPGNTGIFKPIDVLCLQEYGGPTKTGAPFAALLNQMYGTTSFSYGTLAGATTGTGSEGIVYNTATVQLISEAVIGTSSTTGQPRQTLRHQIRPVGYGAGSDVYIYNAHWKAGGASSDATRRTIEANAIRADVSANVPAGANVMYCGDFNVSSGADSSITALTAPGNGQALDPINRLNWTHGEESKGVFTQSPWGPNVDPSNGFTGSGGGVNDRFDFELLTANLKDGKGTAYIPNSYQAFANNGSSQINQPINSGSGSDSSTLFYLSSIVDHLPVVADYQLPARMHVSVAPVPQRVIQGAVVPVQTTVTNSAPVTFSNGADKLDYTVSGTGDVVGAANGSNLAALAAGNVHLLSVNTSEPGVRSGTINASSSSEAVANGTFSQSVSTNVLAHSTPSFSPSSALNVATIDFGIHGRGLGGATASFAVSNLPDASGYTAALDLDSVSATGDVAQLTTDAGSFKNLAPGGSASFGASLAAAANGAFSATYTLALSDEDLPGAIARGPLTLTITGIVATAGDSDLSGLIDFDDYSHIDNGFNNHLTGWSNGDFDGNGVIDFDDYSLIDLNFNTQGENGLQAVPEPAVALLFAPLLAFHRRRR